MAELDETLQMVNRWEDGNDLPSQWARDREEAILEESRSGEDGPIGEAITSLLELAESDEDVTAWGLVDLFRNPIEASSQLFHRFVGFVSTAARGARSLFQPLIVLFHRYAPKLSTLARKLHATGYSLGVNIPGGFTLALNFDFPATTP